MRTFEINTIELYRQITTKQACAKGGVPPQIFRLWHMPAYKIGTLVCILEVFWH